MKNLERILSQFSAEFSLLNGPKLEWKVLGNEGEAYSCKYAGGVISLEAQSPLAAAYGLRQLIMAVSSGFLSDCLGEHMPIVPLRPLFLQLDGMAQKEMPMFNAESCQRVIELGYNSIIIPLTERSIQSIQEFCHLCKGYGLRIFVKHPLNQKEVFFLKEEEKTRKQIENFFDQCPLCDGLFWEGANFNEEEISKEVTTFDLMKSEVALIESSLPESKQLIYALIPKGQKEATEHALLLNRLLNFVGNHTYVAFSAVEGEPYCDHLNPHPFWEALRNNYLFNGKGCIPIFNVGSYKQGEGLWPALIFDVLDSMSSCKKYCFEGIIGIVNQLPKRGSFLDCNLWSASQAIWKGESASDNLAMWFKSQRADIDYRKIKTVLRQTREISLEMSNLHSLAETTLDVHQKEYFRNVLEALFTQLKQMETFLENEERGKLRKSTRPSMRDYFSYFANDVKWFIHQFMHTFHISSPIIRHETDFKKGFWIDSNMELLKDPFRGSKGSRMESIYLENRLAEE